jgi:hypothetical protein
MALSLILGNKLTAEHMGPSRRRSTRSPTAFHHAVHLTLRAKVPGAEQAKFEELAGKAKRVPGVKLLNARVRSCGAGELSCGPGVKRGDDRSLQRRSRCDPRAKALRGRREPALE